MKIVKKTEIKYYKYDTPVIKTLSTYSSITEAINGKEGISFNPPDLYPCVAQNVNSTLPNRLDYSVFFFFDGVYMLQSVTFASYSVFNVRPYAVLKKIEGIKDNIVTQLWTGNVYSTQSTTNIENSTYYDGYMFHFSGSETNLYSTMGVNYFDFSGLYKPIIPSDKDDYDVSKIINHTKIPKINNKYYMMKG